MTSHLSFNDHALGACVFNDTADSCFNAVGACSVLLPGAHLLPLVEAALPQRLLQGGRSIL